VTPSGASARGAALAVLGAVLDRRRPLDAALAGCRPLARLAARDRAFARLLVTTVLRRLGQIDAVIAAFVPRPPPLAARNALRLGAAQLLFLETPAHAAVDATVALMPPGSPWRGLVNAVLRRLSREGATLVPTEDAPRRNTPEWLWRRWAAAYGEARARAIATAHLAEPPLDLSVKADPQGWAARLGAEVLPWGSLRRPFAGPIEALPGYDQGAWWVQDAAAALPARLLGPLAGRTVIDLCAAPGGKTAELAAAGARVVAVERDPKRLARLAANLARLHLKAETVGADAAEWRPPAAAEAVLLDAPCTATGTIRRRPDVAHLKSAADIARLSRVQDRLLAAAAAMLAPGGTLVYCVCSLEPEEGPERIAALLAGAPDLVRVPVTAAEIGGLAEAVSPAGDLRTLPCHLAARGGLDGFYAARLRRLGLAVRRPS